MYSNDPKLSPVTESNCPADVARFCVRVIDKTGASNVKKETCVPAEDAALTTATLLPITTVDRAHWTDVPDVHASVAQEATVTRAEAVRSATPKLSPATVKVLGPVAGMFWFELLATGASNEREA